MPNASTAQDLPQEAIIIQRKLGTQDEASFREWAASIVSGKLEGIPLSQGGGLGQKALAEAHDEYKEKISRGWRQILEAIVKDASELEDAKERFLAGRAMSHADYALFQSWLQDENSAGRLPDPKDATIQTVGRSSATLEGAKARVKQILDFNAKFPPKPIVRGTAVESRQSLSDWVTRGRSLKDVIHPAVLMNEHQTVPASEENRYILWTGGASDCIAVAAYDGAKAFLWHATALNIIQDPRELVTVLSTQVATGAKVYLASQKFTDIPTKDKVVAAVRDGKYDVARIFEGTSLAMNASTGAVRDTFNYRELG